MKTRIAMLGVLFLSAAAIAPAAAQTYPSRAVRIVVPSTPGGGIDLLARLFGERLSQTLGQAFVVENRAGGGAQIGTEYVARSAPDGYTLLMNTDVIVANAVLFRNLSYDPFKDFQPVTMMTRNSWLLAVTPNLPARNLPDFINQAKSKPGAIEYGSSGVGTTHHLAGEYFQSVAGVNLLHVPYKGTGQFLTALLAGEVKSGFQSLPTVMAHLRSGKLRALGMWSSNRISFVPDIPTMSEQGFGGSEVYTWHALFAPAGTSRDIVNRLHAEVSKPLADSEWVAANLTRIGFEKVGSTPEELLAEMKAALPRWGKVVKDANIPLQ